VCQTFFSQRTSLRLHRRNHFNPSSQKKASKSNKKEGNMIDRMISNLGRNKQQRTRQAKEAAMKKEQVRILRVCASILSLILKAEDVTGKRSGHEERAGMKLQI
jgi:hypothetical protein